jgi:hypothetical protein
MRKLSPAQANDIISIDLPRFEQSTERVLPHGFPNSELSSFSGCAGTSTAFKQIHADLCALGFSGPFDRVAPFARRWCQERQEQARSSPLGTFIPLRLAGGEAFQFDWIKDWAIIASERTKLQVAQFKLSHSRAFFLRAYYSRSRK